VVAALVSQRLTAKIPATGVPATAADPGRLRSSGGGVSSMWRGSVISLLVGLSPGVWLIGFLVWRVRVA
jgi:hypothetical protein